jgi:hypothetical protein
MARIFRFRGSAATIVALTMCAAGAPGLAHASPTFDDPGYSACTATTLPGPDQTTDDVTTKCCATHGGIPTGTTYGMGCVAQVDNPPTDYRPTIYMPTRPSPPGEGDDPAFDELEKQPPLPPPP